MIEHMITSLKPAIHPSAIVHPSAVLRDGVSVGPLCVVGEDVEIGCDTCLVSHVVVDKHTCIGARNIVHPFAAIGCDPQHRLYAREPTRLVIGNDNVIREHVTIHRGTTIGSSTTIVGSNCLFMVGAHVAHDVHVGDHVTLANNTLLGGHVVIQNWASSGGHAAVAPFVRVGESAFLAGNAMVERDVPPFLIAAGDRATLRTLNKVGLRRRNIPEASIRCLRSALRRLFVLDDGEVEQQNVDADELERDPFVNVFLEFLREPSHHGIAARGRQH